MYPEFCMLLKNTIIFIPKCLMQRKAELLWNELETNLANINGDVIIENGV